MLAPVVLAARVTMLPEAEAVMEAAESALMLVARADAMDEVVVPDPLQLTVLAWPFTVIVLLPESYTVVYAASRPPVRVRVIMHMTKMVVYTTVPKVRTL